MLDVFLRHEVARGSGGISSHFAMLHVSVLRFVAYIENLDA